MCSSDQGEWMELVTVCLSRDGSSYISRFRALFSHCILSFHIVRLSDVGSVCKVGYMIICYFKLFVFVFLPLSVCCYVFFMAKLYLVDCFRPFGEPWLDEQGEYCFRVN